jgi:DNA-directed RNA polymerase specialized sigma subunit
MNNIELYQQSQSQELAQKLLDEHRETINKHITKWQGTIPDIVIQKHAHKYALDAFQSYDPSKGAAIDTHLFNHLSKLSRLNYDNQNVVKIPEHQIRMIRNYNDSIAHLTDQLGYTPSHEELADHMVIPVAHVKRLSENVNRKDYTYDSDHEDLQQGDIEANPKSLYIRDAFGRLSKKQQQQFQDLTGYNDATILKPNEFGKKHHMKPFEVSRVKMTLAKKFK